MFRRSSVFFAVLLAILPLAAGASDTFPAGEAGSIVSIGSLSASQGWVLLDRRLLWSDDDGATWREDAFLAPPGGRLLAAQFLDVQRGWVVVAGAGGIQVARTGNSGSTWDLSKALSLPAGEEPAGASLSFVDETTGFLMLRLPSSSNSSRGALFRTDDGGQTWRSLPSPPIGDPIRFSSERKGWLAGGPAGSDLFVTRDGGRSWNAVRVAPQPNAPQTRRVYFLPTFADEQEGLLPVRIESFDTGATSMVLYETHDGGEAWTFLENAESSGLSGFDGSTLSIADSSHAWAVANEGHCSGFKTGCWQEAKILHRRDGGTSFEDVTPAPVLNENRLAADRARLKQVRPPLGTFENSLIGNGTQIAREREGFDTACYLSTAVMDTWWDESPYWYVGAYIGGKHASCVIHSDTCPCPPASWFSQTAAQGWTYLPVWVGIQELYGDLSTNTATAFNQGVAEANAAADRMTALGFPSGSIVYFDFERKHLDSIEGSVKTFINGWVSQLHARGQNAGIYGSYLSAAAWKDNGVTSPPDAIWPFNLNVTSTVFGLCNPSGSDCLPDDLWDDHQRIHQYTQCSGSSCAERWPAGSAAQIIDRNFADGPVAVYGATSSPGTIQINATLGGSTWPSAASGVLSWSLTGPTPRSGTNVPTTLSGLQPGTYTLVYTGGGPPGATLSSISPAGSQTLSAGGNRSFTFQFGTGGGVCTASDGSLKASCTPPTVTLAANPMSVPSGNSSTLTWSSSNATSCVASGGWSGTQATSGSKSVTPAGTTTYTLTCSGTGGSTSKSATVTVTGSSPSSPAVYLAAFPETVTAGTPVGLGWATSNAVSCTASGGWSGTRPVSGSATVNPTATTLYTLTCTGAGGSTGSANVTVTVTSTTPSINLSVNPPAIDPGGAATLQWTTSGMSACSGSGGWSGSKGLNGSQQVSPSSTTTYTLNCTGSPQTPQQLARNGAFSGNVSEWALSTNFYANSNFGSCNLTCQGYAYLSEPNGNLSLSNNLVGTMSQDISLPSTANSIALSFWVSISTLETGTTPFDVLSVSLQNTQGTPLQLVQTFSNVNAGSYRNTTFDLTPYKGQTVRLKFIGTTDSSRGTIFRVDDVSVLATFPGQQYTKSATLTVKTTTPVGLVLTATPDVVTPGQSSTLAWTSGGSTSCTASNGWSGSRATSGNQVVTPSATTTYTLSCSGPGGTITNSATVVVQQSSPASTGDLLLFASRQACSGTEPAVLLGWSMPQGADPLVTLRRSDGNYVATINTAVKGPVHEVDAGLVAGHVYSFRVEAGLHGSTIISNDLTVPIASDECGLPVLANEPPHRPVLWAEPPYCENGVAKVELHWTEALGAEWYSLNRIPVYMDSASYDDIPGKSRSFVDSNLTPGAGADYELTAHNSAGSVSSWDLGVVIPGIVCDTAGAPGSFAARVEPAVCDEGKGLVTVRWDPSAGAGTDYRIFEFDGHLLSAVHERDRDFVEEIDGLQPGTVLRGVVQAKSSASATEFREAHPVAQAVPVSICGAGNLAPAVGVASASSIRADQAFLRSSITANGSDTSAYFEWGTSTAYGATTSSRAVGRGFGFVSLGQILTGLSCGTAYHFRPVAMNANGRTNGLDQSFTTLACPAPATAPDIKDQSVDHITQSGAILHALVNPNGRLGTQAYFQYGTNPAVFVDGTAAQGMGQGTEWLPIATPISGLSCGTVYSFRAIAFDSAFATTALPFQPFTTAACDVVPSPAAFYTVTPCRVVDTRNPSDPNGPAIPANQRRTLVFAGRCGIPSSAKAVSVNVTVVGPTADGYLSLYPALTGTPSTSTVNFRQGQVRANNAIVSLNALGGVSVFSGMASTGSVDYLVDVSGYFQ